MHLYTYIYIHVYGYIYIYTQWDNDIWWYIVTLRKHLDSDIYLDINICICLMCLFMCGWLKPGQDDRRDITRSAFWGVGIDGSGLYLLQTSGTETKDTLIVYYIYIHIYIYYIINYIYICIIINYIYIISFIYIIYIQYIYIYLSLFMFISTYICI